MSETSVIKTEEPRYPVFYSEELRDRILESYVGGASLRQIAGLPGMPSYSTLLKWMKKDPKAFDEARTARALGYEEQALEAAERATDKDDTPAQRLKYDAYCWAAEKNDPSRFGKKTTIAGDPNNPIKLIVVTGVPEPSEHQKPPELAADGTVRAVILADSEPYKAETAKAMESLAQVDEEPAPADATEGVSS